MGALQVRHGRRQRVLCLRLVRADQFLGRYDRLGRSVKRSGPTHPSQKPATTGGQPSRPRRGRILRPPQDGRKQADGATPSASRAAYGPVFAAVLILHQYRANKIRPQLTGKIAPRQPFALERAAYVRSVAVNGAATAEPAIGAKRTGRLAELVDRERRTAHRTGSTNLPRRGSHQKFPVSAVRPECERTLPPIINRGRRDRGETQQPEWAGDRVRGMVALAEYRLNSWRFP